MQSHTLTLLALMVVAVSAPTGQAQTSRPSPIEPIIISPAPATAAVETLIRRPAEPRTAARTAGATKLMPVGFDTSRVVLSLAIVLALIFVLRWMSHRVFGRPVAGRASSALRVLSRTVISPKQQLLVVQVGPRRLVVVGDSGQQMNALCEITDPQEVAALIGQIHQEKRDGSANGFGAIFGQARSGFDKDSEPLPHSGVVDEADGDPSSGQLHGRETRDELSGLMDKVRLMSRQFRRT